MQLRTEIRAELLRDALSRTGSASVRCIGRSMEPTVRLGEDVVLEPCDDARAGDVVVLHLGDDLVLHRILWSMKGVDRVVHVGDAGDATPQIASRASIVARAIGVPSHAPGAGKRLLAAKKVARAAMTRLRRSA
jgi:hypothetical protein